MKTFILFFAFLLFGATASMANNVQMSNVSIVNNGLRQISVKFDVSWDNSWRINAGPANYDGVWVFFKYKISNGKWAHLILTGENNTLPSGFEAYQNGGGNKIGTMIYRGSSNLGGGNVSATNITLGVINDLPYDIDLKAFAVEMVYVPAPPVGDPIFGDGNGVNESPFAFHHSDNKAAYSAGIRFKTDATGNVLDDIELTNDGIFVYANDTILTTNPTGYREPFPTMKALWCMKYEISQAQYRDFLNTLDATQQTNRMIASPSSAVGTKIAGFSAVRNFLKIATPATGSSGAVIGCDANNNNKFDEPGDGEWVACNFLLWADVAAYLDWSGLAPMSEIQYERMCRGSSSAGGNPAVFGEFAWGDTSIARTAYFLVGENTEAEKVQNASTNAGNALYAATAPVKDAILRSGIFATATSNRVTSGATYYGIMEMTGSVYEYCITLGNVAGRSCLYVQNGNGVLSPDGHAQLSYGFSGFWPGMEGNVSFSTAQKCANTCEVTGSAGLILRGGAVTQNKMTSVSDRSVQFVPTTRYNDRGGRGVLYIR